MRETVVKHVISEITIWVTELIVWLWPTSPQLHKLSLKHLHWSPTTLYPPPTNSHLVSITRKPPPEIPNMPPTHHHPPSTTHNMSAAAFHTPTTTTTIILKTPFPTPSNSGAGARSPWRSCKRHSLLTDYKQKPRTCLDVKFYEVLAKSKTSSTVNGK